MVSDWLILEDHNAGTQLWGGPGEIQIGQRTAAETITDSYVFILMATGLITVIHYIFCHSRNTLFCLYHCG